MFGLQPSFVLACSFVLQISRTNKIDSGPAKACPDPAYTLLPGAASSGLQKGVLPAAPSGTATLLRLSPSHRFYPKQRLAATAFRSSQLPWLDGRCVQGPGTYSPQHC